MQSIIDTLLFWGMVLLLATAVLLFIAGVVGLALGPFAILGWFALKIAHVVSGR